MTRDRGTHCFVRDRRGAVAVMTAIAMTAFIGVAAIVIDGGVLFWKSNRMQAAVDAAALSATFNLSSPATSAAAALSGNGISGVTPTVTAGVYTADPSVASASRFVASTTSPNAVQVTAATTSPVFFGRIFTSSSTLPIQVSATAARVDLAGLTAGTTLLTVDSTQAAILNSLIGGLLGTSLSLSVASWSGLLNTTITAAQLLPALATQAGLSAGSTYGQLASAKLTVGQIAKAAVSALAAGGTTTGATVTALNSLVSASSAVTIPLSSLINVAASNFAWKNEPVGGSLASALNAQIDLYTLLSDAAQLVNNGATAISLSPSFSLLNLASLSVQVAIGQPSTSTPYLAFSPVGTTVHTAQVRLAFSISLGTLNVPIVATLAPVNILLPVYIEAASGTATLSAISCSINSSTGASSGTAKVAATTGLATTYLGVVNSGFSDFSKSPTVSPATLANVLNLLSVTLYAGPVQFLSGTSTLTFTQAMINAGTAQTVSSTNTSSLNSAFNNQNILTVNVLGAPLLNLSVLSLVFNALSPIFGVLDQVVADLLGALGIRLGAMDVTVTGVHCGVPVLVR